MTDMKMNNNVLVTGASSGIGLQIARQCQSDGFEVINLDRAPCSEFKTITCDFLEASSVQKALAEVTSIGRFTRLVNNVGAVFPAAFESQSPEEYLDAYRLNFLSATECLKAVLPGMREAQFGRVVSISSRAALGKELRSAYAASKGALISSARVWALELGRSGITVNVVAPGPISTPLFAAANPDNSPKTQNIVERIPLQRMGVPADVAAAVSFFLSENSGFITGQCLNVCGGLSIGQVSL